ncbi:MAG: hypothetical protein ACRDOP_10180, partial [Gaiellaceae bacterium]
VLVEKGTPFSISPGTTRRALRRRGARRRKGALAELRGLVVATLQDVKRLAVELRPKALDDFGAPGRDRAPALDVRRAHRYRDAARVAAGRCPASD